MELETNIIYCGDNLEVLSKYVPDGFADLIYIDPPFNSSRNYEVFWGEAQERRAFEDRFGDVMTYLDWMRPRLRELYRVLKPTGSFYYHCDLHASHYVKVELDRIFDFNNFRNEIVWQRTTAGKPIYKNLPKNYDTIFWYTKTDEYTFYPISQPLSREDIRTFNLDDGDGRGPYNTQPIINPGYRPNLRYVYKDSLGREWQPPKNGWRFNEKRMKELEDNNRLCFLKSTIREKYYLSDRIAKGKQLPNIWTDISIDKSESLGYPTQKPLALMERIVKASSNEGDVILDAFCGCGTTLEAAAKLKRKWIGIDFSPTACRVMAERLEKRLGLKEGKDFVLRDMPKTAEQLRRMPPFEFQNWAVVALGGIPNKVKVGDYGIDGRLYLADLAKEHKGDFFETLDKWYPIQVKQVDKAGRPDVDKFQTAMRRDKRLKGYFIAFGFSADAIHEIKRAQTVEGLEIVPITVDELLGFEKTAL